jgi:hypothetical protein
MQHRSVLRETLLLAFVILITASSLHADTRGKLSGKITDQRTKEPLIGVNIILAGTTMGAATDFEGNFVILNIPPETYTVRLSGVGYGTKVVREVRISSGETTTLNETLGEEVVVGQEVVIVATRPIVDTRQTSAVSIMDSKEIEALPVQELNDIVNLQAGVVDGHFRGGRIGEVQYQVDGVSINNPYDNSASIRIDKSIIQEVQVVSGTFDAEYGQAMSGVVNAVLKSGNTERFDYSAEVYLGQYSGPTSRYPFINRFRPTAIQSYQFSLSGPTYIPNTTFLLSVRRSLDEGYLFGERRFNPTDTMGRDAALTKHPTGDNAVTPMGFFNEWSGQGKLFTKLSNDLQLSYQIVLNQSEEKHYSYAWRYNPDGLKSPKKQSFVHGFDLTHTLSQTFFYNISLRQNNFDYQDYMYENIFDPRYDAAGVASADPNYGDGAVIQGVDLGRFIQKTNSYVGKATLTWQADNIHLWKGGVEVQTAEIKFGSPGIFNAGTGTGLGRILEDTLNAGVVTSHPRWFSAFLQDKMEFTNIVMRAGVRMEAFDAIQRSPATLRIP